MISPYLTCDNPTSIIREFIKNINDNKKIIVSDRYIQTMTIHANKKNIKKIKEKTENYKEDIDL
jgi:hypothetical protein